MAKKKLDPSEMGKKGGRARAQKLSPEERSKIARKASSVRWAKGREESDLPKALCGGQEPLRLGNFVEIPCYVLDGDFERDEDRRVITASGMQRAIGMAASGGSPRLASFAISIASNSVVASDLAARLNDPIEFVMPGGGIAKGYSATLLADLCDAVLEARRQGKLTPRYKEIGEAAEVVVRALANVGIVALVDEATGYQYIRGRLALAELLDRYLADNLNRWTKTFSDDFYIHLFRLLGWDYSRLKPGDPKPAEIGRITRDVVYRRLHPGIVEELEKRNPCVVPGKRFHKHHQWLSQEIGHPALKEHLARIETIMALSDNWLDFENKLQRALPMQWDTSFFPWVSDDPATPTDRPRLPPPQTPPSVAS